LKKQITNKWLLVQTRHGGSYGTIVTA
jgi:hypothetical protein